MSVTIELDHEQVEVIVRNDLIEMYKYTDDPEVKKALRKVIRFYSNKVQWEEFKKDNA
jgi:predicted AAA+ superfamily ATPase